jgi:DNA-binding MarR family transcriptional regulator
MELRITRRGGIRRRRCAWEPIGEPRSFFSYWLKRAQTEVSADFASHLKGWGIIPSEWAALREMYRPGRTSSVGLAWVIGMSKGGASKVIDRLVKKGLARRSVGKLDRRCRPVGLTRAGKSVVVLLSLLADDNETKFFGKLRRKARHYLMEALRQVASAGRKQPVYTWYMPVNGPFAPWRCQRSVWGDGS